jgi:hypothetical protein
MTILYREFEEALDDKYQELKQKRKYDETYKWPWSQRKLLKDVKAIVGLDSTRAGQGYDPKWTVPIRNLVIIYRNEVVAINRKNAPKKEAT